MLRRPVLYGPVLRGPVGHRLDGRCGHRLDDLIGDRVHTLVHDLVRFVRDRVHTLVDVPADRGSTAVRSRSSGTTPSRTALPEPLPAARRQPRRR
ncbi:hypothetical protein V6574_22390 [Streptomyces sp. SM1P]